MWTKRMRIDPGGIKITIQPFERENLLHLHFRGLEKYGTYPVAHERQLSTSQIFY